MGKIKEHRKANGLRDITAEEAEDQLCAQLPPGWCEHDPETQKDRAWVDTRLKWRDIVEGAKAYLALIASGFQTVPQGESNRRARICAGCYLCVSVQGCGACQRMSSLIIGDIAGKRTAYADQLEKKACSVCRCPASSIVHFPMSALDSADSAEKQNAYPEFCWRKIGSENRLE